MHQITLLLRSAISASALLASLAYGITPAAQLSAYTAQAGEPARPARGQQLFNMKHGKEWSCASCHGAPPTGDGKHAATGKAIQPLAPAFDAERFTDTAKADKWFRRNCNDVIGRECTAGEKADVLAWLMTFKR